MMTLYDKSIVNALMRRFNQDASQGVVVNIISPEYIEGLDSQIREGKCRFPVVALVRKDMPYSIDTGRTIYTTIPKGKVYTQADVKNYYTEPEGFVPIKQPYSLTVLTTDTAQMEAIVKAIQELLSNMKFLSIDHPTRANEKIRFGVVVDSTREIQKSSSGQMHQTIIPLSCEGGVIKSTDTPAGAIGKAIALTTRVAEANGQVTEASRAKHFGKPSKPKPPVETTIERTQPELVVPQVKFNWFLALLPFIGAVVVSLIGAFSPDFAIAMSWLTAVLYSVAFPWIPIYYFAIHRKKKAQKIEKAKNSAAYQAQCAAAESEFNRLQAEADARYQQEKHEYDTVLLPQYERDLEAREKTLKEKTNTAKMELDSAKIALDVFYEEVKIIPSEYRSIDALQYMYKVVSSSGYDIKTAMEMYDRNERPKVEEREAEAQRKSQQWSQDLRNSFEAHQESYRSSPSQESGGGGSFSWGDAAKVGLAVTGANKLFGGNNDGSGRQNLAGSAGCRKIQENRPNCTASLCSLSRNCTQDGRYRVGSRLG